MPSLIALDRRLAILIALIGTLSFDHRIPAQSQASPSRPDQPSQNLKADPPKPSESANNGFEILSDTRGVDLGPYIKEILNSIKKTWLPLIPQEGRSPINTPAETVISFTIAPDGKIIGMSLDSSDHKDAFNRAAWGAVTGVGQFPQLPSKFTGPNLQLRIHFTVNKLPEKKPVAS